VIVPLELWVGGKVTGPDFGDQRNRIGSNIHLFLYFRWVCTTGRSERSGGMIIGLLTASPNNCRVLHHNCTAPVDPSSTGADRKVSGGRQLTMSGRLEDRVAAHESPVRRDDHRVWIGRAIGGSDRAAHEIQRLLLPRAPTREAMSDWPLLHWVRNNDDVSPASACDRTSIEWVNSC
jgi:hypothetical protein